MGHAKSYGSHAARQAAYRQRQKARRLQDRQDLQSMKSALINDNELRVIGYQRHEQHAKGIVHRPFGTDGYLIAVFTTPVAIHVRGMEQQLPAMTCYLWGPGERQCFGHLHQPWSYSWVNLDGLCLPELLSSLSLSTGQPLTLSDAATTEIFFQALDTECAQHPRPSTGKLHAVLRYWLLDLTLDQQAPVIPTEWLAVKLYLDAHFTEHLTLPQLAEQFHRSESRFSHTFKQYFNTTVLDYLREKRMQQAAMLLRDQNLSIAEVAYQVGFADQVYFARQFKRHFHLTPSEMRHEVTGKRAQTQVLEDRRKRERAQLLREGWLSLVECDFAAAPSLDPRFGLYKYYDEKGQQLYDAVELALFKDHALRLLPDDGFPWVELRWDAPCSVEMKLDVTIANVPGGPDFAMAISGDLRCGYRMRISGHPYLAFETTASGNWTLLHQSPVALDPQAKSYRLALWRADNVFYAELDGQRILEYPEPFAFYGARHQTFAVGRMSGRDDQLQILSLRAFQRKAPRYMDNLEPGRVLLRLGQTEAAAAWFTQIAQQYDDTPLQQEILYLLALAAPEPQQDIALQRVIRDETNPFYLRALQQLAAHYCARAEFARAADVARQIADLLPGDPTPWRVAHAICSHLPRATPARKDEYLHTLARLPVDSVIIFAPLTDLTPLRGMALTELLIGAGEVQELTPLQGMPLRRLTCDANRIQDLTPLRGMPLASLQIMHNRVGELSPLAGLPLQKLRITSNAISDLAPLAGMPLTALTCDENALEALSPLCETALQMLHCRHNRLRDLTPLQSLPLSELACDGNRLTDLAPLARCPLHILLCAQNPLADLSPLHGLPLTRLDCRDCRIATFAPMSSLPLEMLACGGNPAEDLTPLADLPLRQLDLDAIPLTPANLAVLRRLPLHHLYCAAFTPELLPLLTSHPTLTTLNGHRLAHIVPLFTTWQAALHAFRQAPRCAPASDLDLRRFAVAAGNKWLLAVPWRCSRTEAEAFCRWQRGRLVCPETEEQHTLLRRYLAAITSPELITYYHLGLELDRRARTISWCSGAPYDWHHWTSSQHDPCYMPAGDPCIVTNAAVEKFTWTIDTLFPHDKYVVLEWDAP